MSFTRWCSRGAAVATALRQLPARSVCSCQRRTRTTRALLQLQPRAQSHSAARPERALTMFAAEERGSEFAPDYRLYLSEYPLPLPLPLPTRREVKGDVTCIACHIYNTKSGYLLTSIFTNSDLRLE